MKLKKKFQLPREVQEPTAVKSLFEHDKLEPLLNMIEFGSEELRNYNQRLEQEIKGLVLTRCSEQLRFLFCNFALFTLALAHF